MGLTPGRIAIFAVWMDMLPADNRSAAEEAASIFAPFPDVVQFHDPKRILGAAVAASIGAPGKTAWDMYLFYGPGSELVDRIPEPLNWVHQLGEDEWADLSKFYWGNKLPFALRERMRALLTENRSA